MEPFMEPSSPERGLKASEMDAFAGRIVGWRRTDMSRTGSNSAVPAGDPTAPPRVFARGIVKTCGSACHALLPARRVADHADPRHRLGRGDVLGPHPGRPDSRSP